jgi:hypothetical protein
MDASQLMQDHAESAVRATQWFRTAPVNARTCPMGVPSIRIATNAHGITSPRAILYQPSWDLLP